jgi:hypothetical protein
MSVKEIRELEDEVREVSSDEKLEGAGNWEEGGVESDEDLEEDEKEDFSIGDTMLARGDAKEVWGGGLEEELEGEEFGRGFDEDVFEEEEEFGEGEGFSYETMGQSGGGDLYGAAESGGGSDLYGVGGSGSGMDLYGAPGQNGSDSASLYNTAGNVGGESSMYNTGNIGGGKKNAMGSVYQVEGGRQKKFREGGKRKRSELEGHVSRSMRPRKGVSMM